MGGRAERSEFLLLHAFHNAGYIVPDKYQTTLNGRKKGRLEVDKEAGEKSARNLNKKGYLGGLVLEPKRGFHFYS